MAGRALAAFVVEGGGDDCCWERFGEFLFFLERAAVTV